MRNSSSRTHDLFSIFTQLAGGAVVVMLLLLGVLVGVVMLFLTYTTFQMSFQYRDYSVPVGLTSIALLLVAGAYIAKHWHRSTLANLSKHYRRGKLGIPINREQFMFAPRIPSNPFADREYKPYWDAVVGRVNDSVKNKTFPRETRGRNRTLNKFQYIKQ